MNKKQEFLSSLNSNNKISYNIYLFYYSDRTIIHISLNIKNKYDLDYLITIKIPNDKHFPYIITKKLLSYSLFKRLIDKSIEVTIIEGPVIFKINKHEITQPKLINELFNIIVYCYENKTEIFK